MSQATSFLSGFAQLTARLRYLFVPGLCGVSGCSVGVDKSPFKALSRAGGCQSIWGFVPDSSSVLLLLSHLLSLLAILAEVGGSEA